MTTEVFHYFILLIAGLSAAVVTAEITSNVVQTSTGMLMGELVQDGNLRYYAYKGIPYAEKPTGDLRFKPPLPKSPWSGVLNATEYGKVCPQAENTYRKEQMSEDCLFLNVYVPANKTKKISAIAFVHGGEYMNLSGDDKYIYGPKFFLEREVIFISMNHRLGALGFLSLDTEEASGNAGIKDVILSLKWIKRNIENFGGDSNKITLGGCSSGAGVVHFVLLSNKAKNLFNQAILTSGSAFAYRFLTLHPKENALALGRQLNLNIENTTELLLNLRQADPFDIVAAQNVRFYAPFAPSVEIEYNDAAITKTPREIVRDGIPQNVPILAGFNSHEGIQLIPILNKNQTLIEILNNNFELCIPTDIEYPYGSQQSKDLAQRMRQFYLKGRDVSNSTLYNFIDLLTESQFTFPIDSWIGLHKARDDSNTLYYYVFDFDGDLNFYKIVNGLDIPGASHADVYGYLFKTNVPALQLDSIDSRTRRTRDNLMTLLINFIKFGNPTPDQSSSNYTWPPTGKLRNYLILNDQPRNVTHSSYTDKLDFWYDVYEEYYEYVKNGGKVEAKVIP